MRGDKGVVVRNLLKYLGRSAAVLAILSLCSGHVSAQSGKTLPKAFTLDQAINYSLENYPAVRASLEQVYAARSGVALAKTSYLPHADMYWQSNRATRNNIFGLLLPQQAISSISGPVLPSASDQSVWGSTGGLLFAWEPFDFGRRAATVRAAQASESLADSEVSVTRLGVALAVTNAFLTVVAAQKKVEAGEANVKRREVLANSVRVLVTNQLRPGADSSRADAELAKARTQLIQAEQAQAVSRAILTEVLGLAENDIEIDAGPLLGTPPDSNPAALPLSEHPSAISGQAKIDEIRAKGNILDRSYYPRFNLESTIFGRGSGANADGSVERGASGLELDRYNWGAGITISFPAFDIFSIRAQRRIEAANERAERARYDQTMDHLASQLRQAQAALEGARRVAQNTPVQLLAARDAETQAFVRYKSGLGTIAEAADAQGLLVQAEIDNSLARLAVWNDLASVSAAGGDLNPFMKFLKAGGGQ